MFNAKAEGYMLNRLSEPKKPDARTYVAPLSCPSASVSHSR